MKSNMSTISPIKKGKIIFELENKNLSQKDAKKIEENDLSIYN